ncbi:MAG: lytic transglycosylase domain-containing protein [Rhodospirillales bacterium]|nr:lytic transglycosylase domain-containing protein [Rhodospirillales bacterium]
MLTVRPIDRSQLHLLIVVALAMMIGVGFITPAAAGTALRANIERLVVEEASRQGVPASLALAVAKVESNFNPRAESSAGARGVMQIMPKTARDLYGVGAADLWDAGLNIRIGVDYLKKLYSQYGGRWDLALSHYNGGSRVGTPPNARVIPATQGYVDSVLAWQRRFERTNTLVAMAGAVENRDRQVQRISDARAEYWMFDDPTVVRNWRHYIKVADYWLRRKAAKPAADPGVADDPMSGAVLTDQAYDQFEVADKSDRPSDELARRFVARRLQFRDQLTSGTPPWTPNRLPAYWLRG